MTPWWSRAWSWFTVGKRWLIFPAVLAGVAALVALLRGRRAGPPLPGSVPGGAPVGDEADEIRKSIKEIHAGEAQEIAEKAEADRERIRKALGRMVR